MPHVGSFLSENQMSTCNNSYFPLPSIWCDSSHSKWKLKDKDTQLKNTFGFTACFQQCISFLKPELCRDMKPSLGSLVATSKWWFLMQHIPHYFYCLWSFESQNLFQVLVIVNWTIVPVSLKKIPNKMTTAKPPKFPPLTKIDLWCFILP